MTSTVESTQNEAKARSSVLWRALSLFLLALLFRIIGFSWGLPDAAQWNSLHPDESTRQIVGAVVSILIGDKGFNPGFFNYPSLTVYATWLIYQVMLLVGATTPATGSDSWPIIHDIIVAGRIFSVLCGAATAPLIFLLARRLNLPLARCALAGSLVAIIPAHVQHSHFATVDVPATFFCVLCVYLCAGQITQKSILGAAFVAGLAAGTKYNAGIVLVAPIAALWLSSLATPKKAALSVLSVLACVIAFFITTPYSLLDFPRFWGDANGNGFYFEAFVHPKIGSDNVFTNTGNGWIYHLTVNMPFALGMVLLVAGAVGAVLTIRNRSYWPLLAFCAIFFLSLGLSQVRFMRYVLPIAPFFALFAAVLIAELEKYSSALAGAVTTIVTLVTTYGATGAIGPITKTDPRLQALPEITSRPVGMIKNPWFYTPPFSPNFINAPTPDTVVTGFDIAKIREQNAPVFVISDFEIREEQRLDPAKTAEFLTELGKIYPTQKSFKNEGFTLPGRDFVPHDYLYTNPRVWVYSK